MHYFLQSYTMHSVGFQVQDFCLWGVLFCCCCFVFDWVYLLNFSFGSCNVFLISFSCLCSCSLLRLLKRIIVNSVSDISQILMPSGSLVRSLLVFFGNVFFLFYLILYNLCIFVLVPVLLSKSSRHHRSSSSGKDFYLSFQLGILDVSWQYPWASKAYFWSPSWSRPLPML